MLLIDKRPLPSRPDREMTSLPYLFTHSTIEDRRSAEDSQPSKPHNFPSSVTNVRNSEGAPANNVMTTESALPILQSHRSFTAPERSHPPNPSPAALPLLLVSSTVVLSPTVPHAGALSAFPMPSRQQAHARSVFQTSRSVRRGADQDLPKPPVRPDQFLPSPNENFNQRFQV
jgi:hypothetical protein